MSGGLLGDGAETTAKTPARKRRAKGEADASVKTCIDAFYDAYVRRWNSPEMYAAWRADPAAVRDKVVTPLVNGGKHGTQFKRLLASWSEAVVLDLTRLFFSTRDTTITRTDYSLDAFFAKAQYLRLLRQRIGPDRADTRTHENIEAARRAMVRTAE